MRVFSPRCSNCEILQKKIDAQSKAVQAIRKKSFLKNVVIIVQVLFAVAVAVSDFSGGRMSYLAEVEKTRRENIGKALEWRAYLQGCNVQHEDKACSSRERIESLEKFLVLGKDLHAKEKGRVRLDSVDISGLDLSGKFLSKASFREANLRDVNLGNANLSGADLEKTNLYGADLQGVDLRGPGEGGKGAPAVLKGADIRSANLRQAKVAYARQIFRACGDENTKLPDFDASGKRIDIIWDPINCTQR